MKLEDLVKEFQRIRDVPYRIALSTSEADTSCTGKNRLLLDFLRDQGYEARWRVCSFRWSDLHLPDLLSAVPHQDECTHAYLEVMIGGVYKVVDATWDSGLSKILPVNDWDGKSDTTIAVPSLDTFTPEKSSEVISSESKDVIEEDLKLNGAFYAAFNMWLADVRR